MITTLTARKFDLGTGYILAAFQTAAIGSRGANIEIKRIEVSQRGSTSLELPSLAISKRDTAGTLTMTATTPLCIRPVGGPASGLTGSTAPAGAVARSGTNSSADSGGAYTDFYYVEQNSLNGHLWKPDPEEQVWIPPSTLCCVRLMEAPTNALDWTITLFLDEKE